MSASVWESDHSDVAWDREMKEGAVNFPLPTLENIFNSVY
jgi:hypothetical protein